MRKPDIIAISKRMSKQNPRKYDEEEADFIRRILNMAVDYIEQKNPNKNVIRFK